MLAGRFKIPAGVDAEALALYLADRIADEVPDDIQVFGDRVYFKGGWRNEFANFRLTNCVDRGKIRVDAVHRDVRYRFHVHLRLAIPLLLPLIPLVFAVLSAGPWAGVFYPVAAVWLTLPLFLGIHQLGTLIRRWTYLGLKAQGVDPHTVPTRGIPER